MASGLRLHWKRYSSDAETWELAVRQKFVFATVKKRGTQGHNHSISPHHPLQTTSLLNCQKGFIRQTWKAECGARAIAQMFLALTRDGFQPAWNGSGCFLNIDRMIIN